jgi:ribonuclease J
VSYAVAEDMNAEAQDAVRTALSKLQESGSPSVEQLRKGARNALSSYLWGATRTRPMVIPIVMEV